MGTPNKAPSNKAICPRIWKCANKAVPYLGRFWTNNSTIFIKMSPICRLKLSKVRLIGQIRCIEVCFISDWFDLSSKSPISGSNLARFLQIRVKILPYLTQFPTQFYVALYGVHTVVIFWSWKFYLFLGQNPYPKPSFSERYERLYRPSYQVRKIEPRWHYCFFAKRQKELGNGDTETNGQHTRSQLVWVS